MGSIHCVGCAKLRAWCDSCGPIDNLTAESVCRLTQDGKSLATLAELEEQYFKYAETTGKVRPVVAKGNVLALHLFMREMGFAGSASTAALNEQNLETFAVQITPSRTACSVRATLEHIGCLTSASAVRWYKAQGLTVKKIPRVRVNGRHDTWHSLSRSDRKKLRDLQFEYSTREDPRLWLMMTFAWELGMRKSDVLRLSWSKNFVTEDGRTFIDYVANKTGKAVRWQIDDDTVRQLAVARKRLSQLKIRSLSTNTDSVLRVRTHERSDRVTSDIWDALCDDLRRIMGWTGAKAAHNLRKDATDQVFQKYGIDYAEAFSGDTANVLRRSYIGKKRISLDVVSIAKI